MLCGPGGIPSRPACAPAAQPSSLSLAIREAQSRPRRLSRSARSGGGRGYPSPSDGRLRDAVPARRAEARLARLPVESQPGEGRVQSQRVLGPQPHGVSRADFSTRFDSVNEIKDCSIRLPAQALRPGLIAAKIQRAITPSKAERDAACSAVVRDTLASSL